MSTSKQDPTAGGDRSTSPTEREATAITPAGRQASSGVFLGVLGAGLLLAATLVALKVFVADKTPALTQEAVQTALEQWEAVGPKSYDLDVEIGGAQPGVAHVEVRDGEVKVATRDGLPLQEWNKDEWSIPGQFEALERELQLAEDPQAEMQAPPGARVWLRCEFDPEYGYPRRYHRYATGGAPEVYWRTSLQAK